MLVLLDNGLLVGQASNSTKITVPKKSKDLTSQDRVLIKLTPSGTPANGNVSPKNIKVKVGTAVVWQNMLPEKVYVESKPDENHYQGQMLNASYIFPGESREEKLNEVGSFIYDGSNGFGSYYVRGAITVVNETTEEKKIPVETIQNNQTANYDVSQVKWRNFTNDLEQFSIEYPGHWQTQIGNRFTGEPPLNAESSNGNSLIPSWIQIKVFDSDGQTAQKWAQTEKKKLVDGEKDTKLIEPVSCEAYKIDNSEACSFVYASEDKQGRTTANLQVFTNDNASLTHSIKYKTDASVYDVEAPVVRHLLNSYKLIKNNNNITSPNGVE
jgi:hypothetical protein